MFLNIQSAASEIFLEYIFSCFSMPTSIIDSKPTSQKPLDFSYPVLFKNTLKTYWHTRMKTKQNKTLIDSSLSAWNEFMFTTCKALHNVTQFYFSMSTSPHFRHVRVSQISHFCQLHTTSIYFHLQFPRPEILIHVSLSGKFVDMFPVQVKVLSSVKPFYSSRVK